MRTYIYKSTNKWRTVLARAEFLILNIWFHWIEILASSSTVVNNVTMAETLNSHTSGTPRSSKVKNSTHWHKKPHSARKSKKRRLSLLGHILRLHPDTPAQKALDYFMTPHPRPVGGQHKTWISTITKDLKDTLNEYNIKTPLKKIDLESLKIIASDKVLWREVVKRETSQGIWQTFQFSQCYTLTVTLIQK